MPKSRSGMRANGARGSWALTASGARRSKWGKARQSVVMPGNPTPLNRHAAGFRTSVLTTGSDQPARSESVKVGQTSWQNRDRNPKPDELLLLQRVMRSSANHRSAQVALNRTKSNLLHRRWAWWRCGRGISQREMHYLFRPKLYTLKSPLCIRDRWSKAIQAR